MAKYKAYPEYKDSGVEWLGNIPESWSVSRLKHVASIYGRIGFRGYTVDDIVGEGEGAIVLSPSNIVDEKFSLEKKTFLRWGKYFESPEIIVTENDILLVKTGSTYGKSTIIKALNEPMTINPQMALIKKIVVEPRFLAYWFNTYFIKAKIEIANTGSGMPTMTQENINNFPVLIPSTRNDVLIADFLDYETAKIDKLIEKQQQLIELLKEKRQAVISHAVTKGLNPDVPMKDSGVEWLGEVPEHWEIRRLKHLILSLESGCSVNAADIPAQQGETGVLKTSCVYTRSFRPNENKTVVLEDLPRVKCPVKKGSIIISRMNTPDLVGASALVDMDVKDLYLPDRLWQTNFNKKLNLIPDYLAHFMTIKGFRTQISLAAEGASSSMQNIAKDDYLSINCLLPPFDEQRDITKYLEDKLSYFTDLEMKFSEIVHLFQERRTALISAAVTGKIDVRDWVAPDMQDAGEPQETTV